MNNTTTTTTIEHFTDCCGASFAGIGYPECDICSDCYEHAGLASGEDEQQQGTNMNHNEIITLLSSGMCEITYTDSNSIEDTLIATMAIHHLPDEYQRYEFLENSNNVVHFFNVNTESIEKLLTNDIVNVEALTGELAECTQRKLKASDEYLQNIGLFGDSDEDLDAMEYSEDL